MRYVNENMKKQMRSEQFSFVSSLVFYILQCTYVNVCNLNLQVDKIDSKNFTGSGNVIDEKS